MSRDVTMEAAPAHAGGGAAGRVQAIDATRGVAMLAVFLGHFAECYLREHGFPMRPVYVLSQLASPTFMLISGTLLGFFHVTRRARFGDVARNYFGRALFLATISRVLILLFHMPMSCGARAVIHWGFITDAIAVCLMVGPLVVARTSPRVRMALASLLYLFSWWVLVAWAPTSRFGHLVQETLVGPHGGVGTRWFTDMFPVLPWLGVFLIGSCFGEKLGAMPADRWGRAVLAGRWGAMALFLAAAARWVGMVGGGSGGWLSPLRVRGAFSPFGKLPPGPVYLGLYAGVGFLLLAILLACEGTLVLAMARTWLETAGRHSLILFVAQYGVYFTLVPLANLPFTPWWPLVFLATVAGLLLFVRWWDRRGWSRYLTVPIPAK